MSHPKFIQIVCSATETDEGGQNENLYALDADGDAWFYDFTAYSWGKLQDRDCKEKKDD